MSSVQCTHLNGSLYLSHTSFISFDLDSKLLVSRKRSFSMMSKYLKVISSSKTSRPGRSFTFKLTSTFSFVNLARKVTQEAIAMRRSANRAKPRPGILSFNSVSVTSVCQVVSPSIQSFRSHTIVRFQSELWARGRNSGQSKVVGATWQLVGMTRPSSPL